MWSSPLALANDPTFLFTNAGVNQFKDVFLGSERREHTRAARCQKCLRSGKHNDLGNVGCTRPHHTMQISFSVFNQTNHFNAESVRQNVADPKFGKFLGQRARDFHVAFEIYS